MATRRVIHAEESLSPQPISITSTYAPTPKACIIAGSGQQSVTFTNNSGATINIQFEPNSVIPSQKVFNDITGLSPTAPNNTNTQTPQVANGSVNYNVVMGANTYGPYAIQVGNGPMYIQVRYDSVHNVALCTPDPVMIPPQGWLEMVSTDYSYSVQWPGAGGDPFGQGITQVNNGLPNNTPHQETAGLGDYPYKVTRIAAQGGTGTGGGTVKVKST